MDNIPPDLKRKNSFDEIQVDRISELSDDILVKILPIIPLKDAVATLILSKRWKHVWKYLDRLRFTCMENAGTRELHRFASFVDNVLLLSKCTKVITFSLQLAHYPQYTMRIYAWLSWAVRKNVEKIKMDLKPGLHESQPLYELPQNICACPSLLTLDISRCKFMESGIIGWNFLRRLTLSYIVMSDGVVANLLYGCPLLEVLELKIFNGFYNLSINNPNLKVLRLVHYWNPADWARLRDINVLNISAPYIQELEISDPIYDLQCKLEDVSSLKLAHFDFQYDNYSLEIGLNLAYDLIQSVAHVEELKIGTWLLQVILVDSM